MLLPERPPALAAHPTPRAHPASALRTRRSLSLVPHTKLLLKVVYFFLQHQTLGQQTQEEEKWLVYTRLPSPPPPLLSPGPSIPKPGIQTGKGKTFLSGKEVGSLPGVWDGARGQAGRGPTHVSCTWTQIPPWGLGVHFQESEEALPEDSRAFRVAAAAFSVLGDGQLVSGHLTGK